MNKNTRDKGHIYGETFSAEEPRPSAVVFEVLISHLKGGKGSFLETHKVLNDIYKILGNTEQQLVRHLDNFEKKGIISSEDALILVVLLAASRTLGPDLNFLRSSILTGNFNPDQLNIEGLDKSIINFLVEIMPKLKK